MIAVGLPAGARHERSRDDDRAHDCTLRDDAANGLHSAHLLELLRDAHRELADSVMLRAARITATAPQHATILSRLEEAIETTRQLALDECQPRKPSSAGPYLRQRIASGWEHAPQATRKVAVAPASQMGVAIPL